MSAPVALQVWDEPPAALQVWDEAASAVYVADGDGTATDPPGGDGWPLVAKATEPTAADFGTETIPVGAVWVVTP